MSEARITIEGWSMECSGHNYITLYYDGRFVHCFDNDLHIENSPKDEYYTEHIIATIERRTKMKITDIPIIGHVEDFDGKGMKARLAETYISVCENGVCGVCPLNGYKNKTFELNYDEITKMVVKGERLFLYSKKGNVALTLRDASGTAALIKSKNVNL